SSDVTCERTAVLHGLPILLRGDSVEFFRKCFDSDVNVDLSAVDVGLLTVLLEDMPSPNSTCPQLSTRRAIIFEGNIVVGDVPNLPHAECLLFALIYALNLDNPKTIRSTFDAIQRVFLSLRSKNLKPQ
ncbi:hypothetical protein C0J50_20430, partial [Silurus asotus]